MIINKIIHNPDNEIKKATITLDYNEIRVISNLFCKCNIKGKLRTEMLLLFELVKNGCLDKCSLEHALEIRKEETEQ